MLQSSHRGYPLYRITITVAVVLLTDVSKHPKKAWHTFSGVFHSAKGGMSMEVVGILLSIIACLTAYIALGMAILALDNNEKDRPSRKD